MSSGSSSQLHTVSKVGFIVLRALILQHTGPQSKAIVIEISFFLYLAK